jgi:hypothetical protein
MHLAEIFFGPEIFFGQARELRRAYHFIIIGAELGLRFQISGSIEHNA